MNESRHYTECSICHYRKWCISRDNKYICTSCIIDPEHWKKLQPIKIR